MRKLKKELLDLKIKLQQETKMNTGRAASICSEKNIDDMIKKRPKKLDDFKSIVGLGDTFIEKYGKFFLKIIKSYEEKKITNFINSDMKNTLDIWEKKLIKINKKNTNLYIGKLTKKFGFDLHKLKNDEQILSILKGSKRSKLLIAKNNDIESTKEDKKSIYSNLNQVYKETERIKKETGIYNLYIGYPYVEGKLDGEGFNVKAPLLYTPVNLIREKGTFYLERDKNKDVEFNTDLLLTNIKYNGNKIDINFEPIDDVNHETIEYAMNQYNKNGLLVTSALNETNIEKLFENSSKEFPNQYKKGNIFRRNYAVLGRYNMDSSALHSDFKNIVDSGKVNDLLYKLINHEDSTNSSSPTNIIKNKEETKPTITEANINYINKLNYSQETILTVLNNEKSLVVQGPPGTGKSQTITSIIADQILKGQNILIVSEKKTALDVIYSRLGDNSKYSILIDDVKNKNEFYDQLKEICASYTNNARPYDERIKDNEEWIEKKIKELDDITTMYFKPIDKLKTSLSNIYKFYKPDLLVGQDLKVLKYVGDRFEEYDLEDYNEIIKIEDKLNNNNLYEKSNKYLNFIDENKLMDNINQNLDKFKLNNIYDLLKFIDKYDEEIKVSSFFKKFSLKGKMKKEVKRLLNNFSSINLKIFLKKRDDNCKQLKNIHKQYEEINKYKTSYDQLNIKEKNFMEVLNKVSIVTKQNTAPSCIKEYFITYFIEKLESKNVNIVDNLNNYKTTINKIENEINEKTKKVNKNLNYKLREYSNKLFNEKRFKKIKKRIESKRKMNPAKFLEEYSIEMFGAIKIWMMTTETVSQILPNEQGIFDLVVFDEASQMFVERAIPTIFRAKKVCIAGDSKQLKPSNLGFGTIEIEYDEDDERAYEGDSLLDVAMYKYKEYSLNYHYRSKYEELISFSNHAFYEGKLLVAPNVIKPESPPIEFIKVENGIWDKNRNIQEADVVVEKIKYILKNRKHNESIGVITFNAKQRDLIYDKLDKEQLNNHEFRTLYKNECIRKDNGEDASLFIKNIENVQGDERDIIIFSVAYAKNNEGRLFLRFGTLNQEHGENRLNVAITRAKEKIYVISSILPEELNVSKTKNEGPKFFKKYLEYCKYISDGDEDSAKRLLKTLSTNSYANSNKALHFDSLFEEEVYEGLRKMGYEVETQIGVGGYSIDLAVYDKNTNEFIIGIECDGRQFHSSTSARENDYHRQKYLESRGWTIYRVWSPNWWKNKTRELETLKRVIEDNIKKQL